MDPSLVYEQQSIDLAIESFAVFDKRFTNPDGSFAYRYSLVHRWPTRLGQKVVFIMLNPSTADAFKPDPTVRRCMIWAQLWGFRTLQVVNLFAFRSPKPSVMKAAADPVGPLNDQYIQEACEDAGMILCAWGSGGTFQDRARQVVNTLLAGRELWALKLARNGHPWHPLYLKTAAKPFPFKLN